MKCRYHCNDVVTHYCKTCNQYYCNLHAERHNKLIKGEIIGSQFLALPIEEKEEKDDTNNIQNR